MANFGDNFVKNNAIRSLESGGQASESREPVLEVPHGGRGDQSHSNKRILCLWLPNWPIQRLVVDDQQFRRQQVVLFRRDSRRGQVVSAVSPLAMRSGVCVDMPLSEAKSLLRASAAHPHVFEHDPATDLQSIEALADSLECFSPIVGLETIEDHEWKRGRRPDSIFLEVTGLAHLFGDENQLARKVLLHCDDQGYLPRIAIGDTVGMAWAAARYLAGSWFREHQEPVVLFPGDRKTIQQLPVEGLRLEPTTTDTLYQLGVETIGQLQSLSRRDLTRRFGHQLNKRLDQTIGKAEEPVIARRKPVLFQAEQFLEFPTHHRETIEVIINRLVAGLCEQMRSQQRGALEWSIKLTCQTGSPIEFQVNLFQPTASARQVMPLVEMQLEQVLSPLTRKFKKRPRRSKKLPVRKGGNRKSETQAGKDLPESAKHEGKEPAGEPSHNLEPEKAFCRYTTIQVQEIGVCVTSDVLLVQQQRQLFDENPRLDQQTLAHLINRLASRMGLENVVFPLLQSGAQPEYSFRWKPLVDPTRKRRRRRTRSSRKSHTLARPLKILHPAEEIKVSEAHTDPEVLPFPSGDSSDRLRADGFQGQKLKTIQFDKSGSEFQITQAWGPERIETGWWRGRTVCRDYWRVEIETRQHYWIYRELRSRRWFLHGEF